MDCSFYRKIAAFFGKHTSNVHFFVLNIHSFIFNIHFFVINKYADMKISTVKFIFLVPMKSRHHQ